MSQNCLCYSELNGIEECLDVFGGIASKILIAPKCELEFIASGVTGSITGLTFSNDMSEYEFRQGHAFSSISSEIDLDTTTTLFNISLTIHLKGQSLIKRNELVLLTKFQQELGIVFQDEIGTWWALGLNPDDRFGMRVSEITGETGQNRTDTNEYIVVFSGLFKELPYVVDEAIIPTLTA